MSAEVNENIPNWDPSNPNGMVAITEPGSKNDTG